MTDNSATSIVRWIVSVPMSLFTAITALLWALPKSGEGGFLWVLTVPVGLAFVYLTHRLTAPHPASRSIAAPILLTVGLGVLWFGGMIVGVAAAPEQNPSNLIAAMLSLTFIWPWLAALALVLVGVLKLVDYFTRRAQAKAALQGAPRPADPPRDHTAGAAPLSPAPAAAPADARSAREFDPFASSSQSSPPVAGAARPQDPRPEPAPAPRRADAQETLAFTRAQNPFEPESRPSPEAPALTGVSFHDLSTLIEIAASLETDPSSMPTLLTFTAEGVHVTAGDTELGSVRGTWNRQEAVRTRQSARALLDALASLAPAAESISLQPPQTANEGLALEGADPDQRVTVESIRA